MKRGWGWEDEEGSRDSLFHSIRHTTLWDFVQGVLDHTSELLSQECLDQDPESKGPEKLVVVPLPLDTHTL